MKQFAKIDYFPKNLKDPWHIKISLLWRHQLDLRIFLGKSFLSAHWTANSFPPVSSLTSPGPGFIIVVLASPPSIKSGDQFSSFTFEHQQPLRPVWHFRHLVCSGQSLNILINNTIFFKVSGHTLKSHCILTMIKFYLMCEHRYLAYALPSGDIYLMPLTYSAMTVWATWTVAFCRFVKSKIAAYKWCYIGWHLSKQINLALWYISEKKNNRWSLYEKYS